MFDARLGRFDIKSPRPGPSTVFVSRDIVGDLLVDHTTPLAVTEEPPSTLTLPPDLAVVAVTSEGINVLTTGLVCLLTLSVVNSRSSP